MRKIPTLFTREYDEQGKIIRITPELSRPDLECVLRGEAIPTEKIDGACCAIINGVFYKRYDAKIGKNGKQKVPPEGAVPCCAPDPITGHWPHWVRVDRVAAEDRWFVSAYENAATREGAKGEIVRVYLADGTYEAVGPHFRNNPYHLSEDTLRKHGERVLRAPRDFYALREYLWKSNIEGIVWWKDGQPICKLKRTDFGFPWPDH